MEVTFKFKPGQKVLNRFNQPGYVLSASINESGNKFYWVGFPDCKSSWEDEETLQSAPTE